MHNTIHLKYMFARVNAPKIVKYLYTVYHRDDILYLWICSNEALKSSIGKNTIHNIIHSFIDTDKGRFKVNSPY